MSGATVSNPHGWKPGKPAESAEGCLYPTWEREGTMDREQLRAAVIKMLGDMSLPSPTSDQVRVCEALISFFADRFALPTQDALDDIMARMK